MTKHRPSRIIDAHHHLWDLERHRYPWLQDGPPPEEDDSGLAPIRATHLPVHYREAAEQAPIFGTVHVEAAHDPAHPAVETSWVDGTADREGFPQALVAFARLQAADAPAVLEAHGRSRRLRGIRQMLNWEPGEEIAERPDLLDDPAWLAGLELLTEHGLSFDLQLFPSQLARAAEVVGDHPGVLFVLNHGGYLQEANPPRTATWRHGMMLLAQNSNLVVKASSYGSIDPRFDPEGLRWYLSELAEIVGPERMLWGSNFPVEKRHIGFGEQLEAYLRITEDWSAPDVDAFYARNALAVYRIPEDELAPL